MEIKVMFKPIVFAFSFLFSLNTFGDWICVEDKVTGFQDDKSVNFKPIGKYLIKNLEFYKLGDDEPFATCSSASDKVFHCSTQFLHFSFMFGEFTYSEHMPSNKTISFGTCSKI